MYCEEIIILRLIQYICTTHCIPFGEFYIIIVFEYFMILLCISLENNGNEYELLSKKIES